MRKPVLTNVDIQNILNLDDKGRGDRTGAYILLWQLTGSEEALRQARISSFSGGEGGAAFGANLELQKELGMKYPGVFNLSQQVFEDSLRNVRRNLNYINNGTISIDKALFRGGESAWTNLTQSLKHDFPGNAFALNPLSSNFLDGLQFSHGTGVALEGANDAVLFGKSPGDFVGLSGFSAHIVKDYAGQLLVTIKDDRTGRTVFVGTGGSGKQAIEDAVGIIARTELYPGIDLGKMREYLKTLRQNEEPGLLTIDQHGNITIKSRPDPLEGKSPTEILRYYKAQSQLAASKKRTPTHIMLHSIPINPRSQLSSILNAAKNPISDPMHLHTIFTKSRSQHRSFAPVPRRIARSAPPARTTTHHAPAPRPSNSASFTPKIYHDPEGNLPPSLAEYFYRLSRLPPNGGTAFDPYLTPTWAGLKLPG